MHKYSMHLWCVTRIAVASDAEVRVAILRGDWLTWITTASDSIPFSRRLRSRLHGIKLRPDARIGSCILNNNKKRRTDRQTGREK